MKWRQHPIHSDLVVFQGSEDPVFLGDIDRDAETAVAQHNADIEALEKENEVLRMRLNEYITAHAQPPDTSPPTQSRP